MNDFELIRLSDRRHAEYADASIVRSDSETVYLAGGCPLDAEGAVVAPGDLARQTRQALHNMDLVLQRCRVSLENVAFLRILVATDRSGDLGLVWNVVREHFGSHEMPATLQGVPVLGHPGQLVELEPIAARSPS
ncbi:Rid family hydrolase [Rathayibacter sp. YIM 133350]|uniref:RidA family protein n=1 Tax=Rathayibacter sp. YIM 133350 TaxID=3131992 RepID=UPI00307E83A7